MILIIGGEASGKREFAMNLGYGPEQISDNVYDSCPVTDHLEKTVFDDPGCTDRILPLLLDKEAVICSEVGSGVIPVDAKIRSGREATGRLCILLAGKATAVVRLVCGIPTVIKGSIDR